MLVILSSGRFPRNLFEVSAKLFKVSLTKKTEEDTEDPSQVTLVMIERKYSLVSCRSAVAIVFVELYGSLVGLRRANVFLIDRL